MSARSPISEPTNSEFRSVLKPLQAPLFTLQMATGKARWSTEARLRALRRAATALRQALDECNILISRLERHE